ncbi:hypothetical protein Nepgr_030106 [Nepenthes gracilis]|uniref:Secreted protein n=1 Tax=Nepenthes gracilis TaxID=150966 RepID=A0AAD3TDW4_NEPGR|nr:hypothetical protein Nepgr_030106 [Nepenthes gracilis]
MALTEWAISHFVIYVPSLGLPLLEVGAAAAKVNYGLESRCLLGDGLSLWVSWPDNQCSSLDVKIRIVWVCCGRQEPSGLSRN